MKNIQVDAAAFSDLRRSVLSDPHLRDGIGTYKEKKLHLILKEYFVRSAENREVPFRGFVCDGKEGDVITEVMTGSLSGMGEKLKAFLPDHRVNIIFPLIAEKTLVWIDPETGDSTKGRISPRRDGISRLLSETVYILDWLSSPNLTLTAVSLRAEEFRLLNGRGKEKKIGAEKLDRVPSEILSVTEYYPREDMALLLPEGLPDRFTRNDVAGATGFSGRRLSGVVKALVATGVISDAGLGNRPRYYEISYGVKTQK